MTFKLYAREPWKEAVEAYLLLDEGSSPGDVPNWRLYWIAGIVLLRSIGHVLDKVDANIGPLHRAIIDDFWRTTKNTKEPIFWEFIDAERNNILKSFSFQVRPHPVTISGWHERNCSYEELVRRHGEFKMLWWGEEGDDGLRLYEIALEWWDQKLRVIEQGLEARRERPFSSGYRVYHSLLSASYERAPSNLPKKRL